MGYFVIWYWWMLGGRIGFGNKIFDFVSVIIFFFGLVLYYLNCDLII